MATAEALGQISNNVIPKNQSRKTSGMTMGVYYLPKPRKDNNPLGEDAYFVEETKHTFGLADGVGGWAEDGVDAGQYARDLMNNALEAVKRQPTGAINPKQVLNQAYSKTLTKGSSTACIITLKDKTLHAVNIGDSGFVVIRGKDLVFETKPQHHSFNFPYQLGKSPLTGDLPIMADEMFVQVKSGDVAVAGTDGLFDNVYKMEIADMVETRVRGGDRPEDTARKMAKRAKLMSFCRFGMSPFQKAAREARFDLFGHTGGKYDDVTVVVAYIL